MRLFKKKQLTPEEQEEKSRREKEWADRCYRAGERFGKKYNVGEKINRINDYANKYPKTFFLSVLSIIVGSFAVNWLVLGISFTGGTDLGTDIQRVTLEKDRSKDVLSEEITSLYMQMDHYNKQLERYINKDSLTRKDSMEIGRLIMQLENLNAVIQGKEGNLPALDSVPLRGPVEGKEDQNEKD